MDTTLDYIHADLRGIAVPLSDLTPDPRNARKHSEANLRAIRASFEKFGVRKPIVVQRSGGALIVRAGNGRMEVARQLGWTHLPAIVVDEDDAAAVAFALADNRSAELAEWDTDVLAELAGSDLDGLDLGAFSWEGLATQLDSTVTDTVDTAEPAEAEAPDESQDDELPSTPAEPVTQPGDVVQLGSHVLHCADCMDVLRGLPDNSVDAIVTDPPYGLSPDGRARTWDDIEALRREGKGGPKSGFMGSEWDAAVPGISWARECLRVLKPGGHLIAHSATRTVHRLACAIEDAGFELKDQIGWITFQGFPKGLHVVHEIAKLGWCQLPENANRVVQTSQPLRLISGAGGGTSVVAPVVIHPAGIKGLLIQTGAAVAFAEVTDTSLFASRLGMSWNIEPSWPTSLAGGSQLTSTYITSTVSNTTIDQKTWSLLTARLTFVSTTPASVILRNGYAFPALTASCSSSVWPASCEPIPLFSALGSATWNTFAAVQGANTALKPACEPAVLARKPLSEPTVAANVLRWGTGALNSDACRYAPGDPAWPGPQGPSGWEAQRPSSHSEFLALEKADVFTPATSGRWPANIYACPKPARSEREAGTDAPARNVHPTVKPIKLYRWLLRLVTPPGGTVFEPFGGSGTTLVAAEREGFRVIAVEREPAYCDIIRARVQHALDQSS